MSHKLILLAILSLPSAFAQTPPAPRVTAMNLPTDKLISQPRHSLVWRCPNDYAVFQTESQIWRDRHIHIFQTLGNHEFHGPPQQALENW